MIPQNQNPRNPHEFTFEGHIIRFIVDDNTDSFFVAGDICKALSLSSVTKSLLRLDEDEKGVKPIQTLGGIQSVSVVSESGMYKLIVRSDKPNAKSLLNKITREVLPQVMRTGHYIDASKVSAIELLRLTWNAIDEVNVTAQRLEHEIGLVKFQQDTIQSEVHQLDSRVVKLERNPRKGYAKVGDYMFSIKRNESLERIGLLEQRAMQLSADMGYDIQQLDGDRLAFHNDVLKRL